MAKNTLKNQLGKEARKRYDKANLKYQSVAFKISELEEINAYCEKYGIPKNRFFRESCMNAIGKTID